MRRGKIKVRGGVKKRFRVTAKGKLKRKRAYHSHILTKKSPQRKDRLTTTTYVADCDESRMKKLLAI